MRRGLVVAVALLVLFAPVLAAPPDEPLKTIAGRMVTQFRVGERPNVLTAQNVDTVIAFLPSFGEQTLQNLKAAAPFRSTRQLQDAGLNAKQIIVILVLFNLQPNDDYEGGTNANGNA